MSLRLKLGLGAALLSLGAIVSAGVLYIGMTQVAERLETALASENRMARYATLATQISTFLVIVTESVQRGLPAAERSDRIAPVVARIEETYALLRSDLETAVLSAQEIGIDQQSRFGTQSLGLARMQALLDSTVEGLGDTSTEPAALRAHIDGFASSIDPLLNQAVNTEVMFRNAALEGIEELRRDLTRAAFLIAGLALLAVLAFHFALVRPQFSRLDRLRTAARQIGAEDYALALPAESNDEIGQLYAETNRMAAALAARHDQIQQDWTRLNEIIDQRTGELRVANLQLAEIDENRRRFFADVSHELRTPLTVILMEAQIGRKGVGDPVTSFTTIEARAARLNRRIDDLLRVARSDSGQLELDLKSVAVADLIRETAAEVDAEIANAGMALTCGESPDLTLTCDPNWLRQILVGLVRNAIRHARTGEAVHLSASAREGVMELAVLDNGPGILDKDQKRVFDRFVQSADTYAFSRAEGFGIGLALARWVVEAQRGAISLISPVPRDRALGRAPGTEITIRLPCGDTERSE